jgi:O-antigen/teichoic acid export membrane protein
VTDTRRAVRQTAWVAGGAYAKTLISFAANIVLMRLIAPEHFGLLAMAIFFLTLGRKLLGFGFNHALIHRQDNLDRYAPTHFALHGLTAALIIVAAAVAYPLVKNHYGFETASALIALAIFGAFEAAGHTPRILLEKNINFSPLVKLDLINVVASNAIGIALALCGFGWQALVGRQAAAWIIQSLGAWKLLPAMPGWRPSLGSGRWFMRFGKPMWIAGIATLTALQFDDFLVGSLDSKTALGYYSRAYALAVLPTAMITHIVTRVAFPIYAGLQNDRERLSRAFARVLRFIVNTTTPMGVLMALAATELVPLFFGERWLPMTPLFRLLLIYTCLRPIYDDCGQLFTALGHPEESSRILVHQAAFVLLTCPPLTWQFGAGGAAVSVGLAMLLGVVQAYQRALRYVNLDLRQSFIPPAVAATVAAAGVFAVLHFVGFEGLIALLAAKTVVFTSIFVLVLVLMQGGRIAEDIRFIQNGLRAKSHEGESQ